MDKRTAGLLGAVAGIATIGSAQANTRPTEPAIPHQVTSYADLLGPIPNAVELLKFDDAKRSRRNGRVRLTQGYYYDPYNGYSYYPPPPVNYYSPYYTSPYYTSPYYTSPYYTSPYYTSPYNYYYHHHHHHHHHWD